jgi:hypothetical protein
MDSLLTKDTLELINHYLISSGTFYYAEEIKDDGTVIVYGPEITCDHTRIAGVYIAEQLVAKLEKCSSTAEVERIINTEWITH